MDSRYIRIGSRESRLAVIQSEIIIDAIKEVLPEAEIELVTMKTTGDMILDKSLDKIGGKGLFVKELDMALLNKRCDISVHSLKDMPMEISEALPVLAYSKREDARDVLVLREGLRELPKCPVIGTGSRRRALQAAAIYPTAIFRGIRGNLTTRFQKLDEGGYDALILAAAGMVRMGLTNRIYRYFEAEELIPCAGQGIMAAQGRNEPGYEFMEQVNSKESEAAALAERSFVRTLDGGCSSPIAAYARVLGSRIELRGLYYKEGVGERNIGGDSIGAGSIGVGSTGEYITGTLAGSTENPEVLGRELALLLKRKMENG